MEHFTEAHIAVINGITYIKNSAVQQALVDAEVRGRRDAPSVIFNGCIAGEVRTIQAVTTQEFLVSGKWGKKEMRTTITLKKTPVVYRAGMKVRLIIEKD